MVGRVPSWALAYRGMNARRAALCCAVLACGVYQREGGGAMAIKTERVMLALFTDEDGRQIAAGASLDESGRDWFDVVNDWCDTALSTEKTLDYSALDPNFKVGR